MVNFIRNPIFQLGLYKEVDRSTYDCVATGELSTCTKSNPSFQTISFNRLPEHTETDLYLKFGNPIPRSKCLDTCNNGLVVEGTSIVNNGEDEEKCYCIDNAHRKVIDLIKPSCTDNTFGGCFHIITKSPYL